MKYFFLTNDGTEPEAELMISPFNAVEEQNDYEVCQTVSCAAT